MLSSGLPHQCSGIPEGPSASPSDSARHMLVSVSGQLSRLARHLWIITQHRLDVGVSFSEQAPIHVLHYIVSSWAFKLPQTSALEGFKSAHRAGYLRSTFCLSSSALASRSFLELLCLPNCTATRHITLTERSIA